MVQCLNEGRSLPSAPKPGQQKILMGRLSDGIAMHPCDAQQMIRWVHHIFQFDQVRQCLLARLVVTFRSIRRLHQHSLIFGTSLVGFMCNQPFFHFSRAGLLFSQIACVRGQRLPENKRQKPMDTYIHVTFWKMYPAVPKTERESEAAL